MTRRTVPTGAPLRKASFLAAALALLCPARAGFGWGRKGHVVATLIAEHFPLP